MRLKVNYLLSNLLEFRGTLKCFREEDVLQGLTFDSKEGHKKENTSGKYIGGHSESTGLHTPLRPDRATKDTQTSKNII